MMLGCERVFEDSEVERFVDATVFAKYEMFVANIEVDMDLNRRWCPSPGCGRSITLVQRRRFVQCGCGTEICLRCGGEALEMHTCGKNKEQTKFEIWKKQKGGKHCPMCGIVIIKNGGCNHITCEKCHHQFCWYDL